MIQKLRTRFIIASMLALTVVLTVILGGVNWMSFQKVTREADAVLAVLAENGGQFPQRIEQDPQRKQFIRKGKSPAGGMEKFELSPETPFESRFFTVDLNEAGQVTGVDIRMIAAVDQETAAQCAEQVFASGKTVGFWGDFRYLAVAENGQTHIFFLDCGRSLSHFRTTLLTSAGVSAGGLLAVLALLLLLSGRIVKPVAESYEKQKRFITDAGHEIKTPLTVIGADLELAELECGENEWLKDIHTQVERLTGLTNDLITLSRMDEEQPCVQSVEFPVSEIVEETAQSFQALAVCQGKTFALSVQPLLSMTGQEKDIRRLVSIFADNAVKYTQDGGEITLKLEKKGKNLLLSTENTLNEPMPEAQVSQLFERFYRADPARSTSGGYGLGLSIARGIVTAHRGSIQASSQGNRITITAVLPTK